MSHKWPLRTIVECAADEPYSTQIGPFGKALTPEAYQDSGIPLLRGVNVNHGRFHDDDFVFIGEEDADRLSKFEAKPGDVLLVHKGTLGQIGLMPERTLHQRYIMGNSMLRVRCDRGKLLPEFLRYWLLSPAGQQYLLSRVSQVGVPQIQRPLSTLREASLPVPPISTQEEIVSLLGALDDKIEHNQRTAKALEALARATFRAWFVDFEPVAAKAGGASSFASMQPEVFGALSTRIRETDLGHSPVGWESSSLGSLVSLSKAQIHPQDHPGEIFEHFSIPAFDSGAQPKLEPGAGIRSSKFLVSPNCVLVSKLNPRLPRVWAPSPPGKHRQIASTELLVVEPLQLQDRAFIYWQFQQPEFQAEMAQKAFGTSNSHQRVKPRDFLATPLFEPPPTLRRAFADIGNPILATLHQLGRESSGLASTQEYLLPKLFKGEVRVQAAEEVMREAG